jgi:hypothetical protein
MKPAARMSPWKTLAPQGGLSSPMKPASHQLASKRDSSANGQSPDFKVDASNKVRALESHDPSACSVPVSLETVASSHARHNNRSRCFAHVRKPPSTGIQFLAHCPKGQRLRNIQPTIESAVCALTTDPERSVDHERPTGPKRRVVRTDTSSRSPKRTRISTLPFTSDGSSIRKRSQTPHGHTSLHSRAARPLLKLCDLFIQFRLTTSRSTAPAPRPF